MTSFKALLITALLGTTAVASQATTIDLATQGTAAGYGQWNSFNVSDIDALSHGVEWVDNANSLDPNFGSPLSFAFTIAQGSKGLLTVVDAGFSGDTFTLSNLGAFLATTSVVPSATDLSAHYVGTDFDAALGDASFSRAVLELGAGNYRIAGALAQSVIGDFDGLPLNSTVGAVQLLVSPVPEPSTYLMLLAGLGLVGVVKRRGRR